jgi:hypothetical protein
MGGVRRRWQDEGGGMESRDLMLGSSGVEGGTFVFCRCGTIAPYILYFARARCGVGGGIAEGTNGQRGGEGRGHAYSSLFVSILRGGGGVMREPGTKQWGMGVHKRDSPLHILPPIQMQLHRQPSVAYPGGMTTTTSTTQLTKHPP